LRAAGACTPSKTAREAETVPEPDKQEPESPEPGAESPEPGAESPEPGAAAPESESADQSEAAVELPPDVRAMADGCFERAKEATVHNNFD